MATEKDFIKDLEGLPLTRRDFLKGAAGAFIVASLGPSWRKVLAQSVDAPPEEWDEVTDVVVVGTGVAGLNAAIEIRDAGVDVLILEKAPEKFQGGNSSVSGQAVFYPDPNRKDEAITYFKELCLAGGPEYLDVPEDMIETWVVETGKNAEWMRSLGGRPMDIPGISEYPHFPGAGCGRMLMIGPVAGSMWGFFKGNVDKRGVRILYETPAKKLIQDPDTREIIGVVAERGGREINIKARRSVVLACGGFENNDEMHSKYMPYLNAPTCGIGTPYNTGDGIIMGLAVGADLWHMDNQAGPFYEFRMPGYNFTTTTINYPGNSFIWVGGDGRRFRTEERDQTGLILRHGKMLKDDKWVSNPTPPNMHAIFDEKVRRGGSLCPAAMGMMKMGWQMTHQPNVWSRDNMEEIRKGWIIQADSIRELARKIDIDPSSLEDTVRKFDDYCRGGKDPEFNRGRRNMAPIDRPPFYALPLTPAILNTQGGPRRNAGAQIVDTSGESIPRLYSAGELGSIYSYLYQGGGNLGECVGIGRLAGRNAAREVRI